MYTCIMKPLLGIFDLSLLSTLGHKLLVYLGTFNMTSRPVDWELLVRSGYNTFGLFHFFDRQCTSLLLCTHT